MKKGKVKRRRAWTAMWKPNVKQYCIPITLGINFEFNFKYHRKTSPISSF